MIDKNRLEQLKTALKSATKILVLLPPDPDADSLSSALALHLSLKQAGKTSMVGCPTPVKVGDSHIFGVDEVKANVGARNLVVSFPYEGDAIDHVSYDIDENAHRFNLLIKPKDGTQLNPKDVEFSFTGAEADLVFTFGISSLEELGRTYAEEKQFLDSAKIANIRKGVPGTAPFAAFDLTVARALDLAEITTFILRETQTTATNDAATNLYRQIVAASNNFQSPQMSADTFELIAYLLRSGAQRPGSQPQRPQQNMTPQRDQNKVPADWQTPKVYRGGGQLK